MKIKTDELIGTQLDWAVATCEGYSQLRENLHQLKFSSDWALAGPIIEREGIATRAIRPVSGDNGYIFTRRWIAEMFRFPGGPRRSVAYGTTPLIAAMRAYVASRLGDEIEVPEELK